MVQAAEEQESLSLPETPTSACFWLNHAGFPTEQQRTIVMTGVARSGTSFVGSVCGRLGVPHGRDEADRVSGHWEHYGLRVAFKAKNEDELRRIVIEFNGAHEVWGWKLPSLRTNLDLVLNMIRNPCFIFTFKEPLSMAMRKIATGHNARISRHFKRIFADNIGLVEFAESTRRPVMLVSYDRALRRLDECIAAIARFSGVTHYDLNVVKAGIEEDARRY